MFHIFLDCLLKQERNLILAGEYEIRQCKTFYDGEASRKFSNHIIYNYKLNAIK